MRAKDYQVPSTTPPGRVGMARLPALQPSAGAPAGAAGTPVLLADDDPDFRRMLTELLTDWGYRTVAVGDGQEALAALLRDDAPKLALLDWMMPGLDGVEVCRELRKRAEGHYTYILLLTGRGGKQDLVEGLEAGADGYLIKPIDLGELRARLKAARRIVALQELHLSTYEFLHEQATHDPLTGLWNHGVIRDILEQELARSRRKHLPLTVIMADLDHFKRVNDTYGHLAGNVVLRECAQRIQRALRPYDTIGRYGGEEFLMVLSGCDAASAERLGERLRRCLADEPVQLREGPVTVTMSLGTASTGSGAPDGEALLAAADTALYRAKRAGRNRVESTEVHEPSRA